MTDEATTLILQLANPSGASVEVGPFSRLVFQGETLMAEPAGKVIARRSGHQWELEQGGRFSRLQCSARVRVRFQSDDAASSKSLGPYESFSSIDGVAYADHKPLAFCDRELQDWYSHDTGTHWELLVVEPSVTSAHPDVTVCPTLRGAPRRQRGRPQPRIKTRMPCEIFYVPHQASFRWKWRHLAEDGSVEEESEESYELFYECVVAAREHGYQPKIRCS